MAEKITHCEHCKQGPFPNDVALWNHPCPGRETTIQRRARVLLGYRPKPGTEPPEADLEQPVYEDVPLPKVDDIIDRPGGRRARVLSAVVDEGSQILGIRYVD